MIELKKMRKYLFKLIKLIKEGYKIRDKIRIILWVFLNIKKDVFLKNEDGLFFVRGNGGDIWMMSPEGEKQLRKDISLSEGVFFDIGANVGKYSILINKQLKGNGKVYAFEPVPKNIEDIEKNMKLNNIKDIEIIKKACSDSNGETSFYLDEESNGGHSLVWKTNRKISVKLCTLDWFIEKYNIKRVDLVKIDVQGAEHLVLKGGTKMLKKFKPKIVFESGKAEIRELISFLEKQNYYVKKISEIDYFAMPIGEKK